jgi:hypothetical protein
MVLSSTLNGQETRPTGVYPILGGASESGPGVQKMEGGVFIRVGPMISLRTFNVHSIRNDNQRYNAAVTWNATSCGPALLQIGQGSIPSISRGGGQGRCHAEFLLEPDQATRVALLFGTKRVDRREIGQRVTSFFTVSASKELVMHLANPTDAPAVRWERGASICHFEVHMKRNGQPIPAKFSCRGGGVFRKRCGLGNP